MSAEDVFVSDQVHQDPLGGLWILILSWCFADYLGTTGDAA